MELGWTGRVTRDPKQSFEEVKLVGTANELRAARGEDLVEDEWGDAPLNPDLIPLWQAEKHPEQIVTDKPAGGKNDAAGAVAGGKKKTGANSAAKKKDTDALAKSFGLPVYYVEV